MSTQNSELTTSLDDAVAEVLGLLEGLDLEYEAELDRYRSITRQLNRALRHNALENEWAYYATTVNVGNAQEGTRVVTLNKDIRPRIINDDAVRLVDEDSEQAVRWAYILPRDALHKYGNRDGLWCSVTHNRLEFSRNFWEIEADLQIHVPVMREPKMFRLPDSGETVPKSIRMQELDFFYPDLITSRAAYYYAQSDPVMQPRAQTLEAGYKDLMYQLIERDTRHTDTPYMNEEVLPIQNGLRSQGTLGGPHPISNYWMP